MGRIRNNNFNTGVKGFEKHSIFEYCIENAIEEIQNLQRKSIKQNYDIIAENGTYISKNLAYDNKKMELYLLNLNHIKGGSKAKFLRDVLGYKQGDGLILFDNIKQGLIDQMPIKVTSTPSGVKQEYIIKIKAKNGDIKTARVIVIVQKDNGKSIYRIITMIPYKKEE